MPRVSVSRVGPGRSQVLAATSRVDLNSDKVKVLLPFHPFFNQGIPLVILIFKFSLDCPTNEISGFETPHSKFDFRSLLGLELARGTRMVVINREIDRRLALFRALNPGTAFNIPIEFEQVVKFPVAPIHEKLDGGEIA